MLQEKSFTEPSTMRTAKEFTNINNIMLMVTKSIENAKMLIPRAK